MLVQAYANGGGLDAGRVWSSADYSVSEQKLAALWVSTVPAPAAVPLPQSGTA